MRIIIIDDNASLRKVLGALFLQHGHEVLAALADGELLESCLDKLKPDLICLDYHLPGRDGLQLMQVIQQRAPHVAVLFMTASSQADLQQRATDIGVSGFINKPFSPQQILHELDNVLMLNQMVALLGGHDAKPARESQKGTAVIADDSPSVRLALQAMLQDCGVKVLQAVANGREAIEATSRLQPELLFLDINMPQLGGVEALPQLRQQQPQTKVVMISGAADRQLVTESAQLGAVAYIVKPLRASYVEKVTSRLLG